MIGVTRVSDDDEVLIMTARGKIQRIAVSDINMIGRNTQGVRIMSLDEEDTLAAVVRVPKEDVTVDLPPETPDSPSIPPCWSADSSQRQPRIRKPTRIWQPTTD